MVENRRTAANKSSALRWAVGLVIVLLIGVVAWLATGYRGQSTLDSAPQNQSDTESNSGTSQPPAVIPNQDAGTDKPATTPPAGEGTTQ
jgi:cytoskeletal protein RodZ